MSNAMKPRTFLTSEERRADNQRLRKLYEEDVKAIVRRVSLRLRKEGHRIERELQEVDGIWISPTFIWFGKPSWRQEAPSRLTVEGRPIVQVRVGNFRTVTKKDGSFDDDGFVAAILSKIDGVRQNAELKRERDAAKKTTESALKALGVTRDNDWGWFRVAGQNLGLEDDGTIKVEIRIEPDGLRQLKPLVEFLRSFEKQP